MRHFSRNLTGVLTMFVGILGVCSADVAGEQIAILEPPPGGQSFGHSTATDGEFVVVGDPQFDPTISEINVGAAIVYRRIGTEWVQDAILIPDNDYPELQYHGQSVAIDQGIIVVGAYRDSSVCDGVGHCSMGSASVFRREAEGWVFEAKLFPEGIAEISDFGLAVSVSDGRALVSAFRDRNEEGQETGAVYVFRREGTDWVDEARLKPSDVSDGSADHFSVKALVIDGERLLIGARTIDGAGAAYVFRREGTTWTEEAKLRPPDPANGDAFGDFLDLRGDVAVVAGKESNAFVYRLSADGWSFDATVSNLDIVPNSVAQGTSVNTDGAKVLVATIARNNPNSVASTFAIYQHNDAGWIRTSILEPAEDIAVSVHFLPTSMRGGLVSIGARPLGTDEFRPRNTYIFSLLHGPVPTQSGTWRTGR